MKVGLVIEIEMQEKDSTINMKQDFIFSVITEYTLPLKMFYKGKWENHSDGLLSGGK